MMPTLVLAPARRLLTGGPPGQEQTVDFQLARAAKAAGWAIVHPAPTDPLPTDPELAVYVTTDAAVATARAPST